MEEEEGGKGGRGGGRRRRRKRRKLQQDGFKEKNHPVLHFPIAHHFENREHTENRTALGAPGPQDREETEGRPNRSLGPGAPPSICDS